MADVRDVVKSKLKQKGGSNEPATVDEVKKATDDIDVVSKVTDRAAKLVGLDKLQKEKRDMEQKLEQAQAELEKQKMEALNKQIAEINAKLDKAMQEKDIPAVKALEHKLEEARETYHREHDAKIEKELAELRKVKSPDDIIEIITGLEEMKKKLGLTPEAAGITPEIQLELKRMDHDLQLKLEQMRKEEKRLDKEWQLTLKKWDEERELRKEEAKLKYQVEQERTDTLKSAFDRGARIIGRAISEGEEEETAGKIAYHVEAEEGEMGDFDCPKCKATVAVAPDAVRAVCAKCGFAAGIKRVKKVEPKT